MSVSIERQQNLLTRVSYLAVQKHNHKKYFGRGASEFLAIQNLQRKVQSNNNIVTYQVLGDERPGLDQHGELTGWKEAILINKKSYKKEGKFYVSNYA